MGFAGRIDCCGIVPELSGIDPDQWRVCALGRVRNTVMKRDSAIAFLAIGQTLIWASAFYVFPALLLRWEQSLGWPKADLTAAITMAVLVSALASPVSGRIIDRGLGPPMMGVSAGLAGLGLVLLSGVTELWQFYAVWVVIGLALAGCLYEPCFAILTRSRGARAKQAIILITLVAGFAGTISFPTFYGLSEAMGWRAAVRVVAAVVIFGVAPVLWLGARGVEREHTPHPAASPVTGSARAFLRTSRFWFLAAGLACLAMVHSAALYHLLPILDERGLSPEMAVLAAAFIGPMQVAGRLAMMATEKYLSIYGGALAAFATLGLSVALLMAGGASPGALAAFVILFGSAYGTVSILRPLLARDILGQADFGAKSGALALPFLAGSASAPYVGSLIWIHGGYDLMLTVMLAITGLGCVLYLNANRLRPLD